MEKDCAVDVVDHVQLATRQYAHYVVHHVMVVYILCVQIVHLHVDVQNSVYRLHDRTVLSVWDTRVLSVEYILLGDADMEHVVVVIKNTVSLT